MKFRDVFTTDRVGRDVDRAHREGGRGAGRKRPPRPAPDRVAGAVVAEEEGVAVGRVFDEVGPESSLGRGAERTRQVRPDPGLVLPRVLLVLRTALPGRVADDPAREPDAARQHVGVERGVVDDPGSGARGGLGAGRVLGPRPVGERPRVVAESPEAPVARGSAEQEDAGVTRVVGERGGVPGRSAPRSRSGPRSIARRGTSTSR